MRVLLVTIDIKPEHKEQFMEEMLADARGSVTKESGCLRFDIIQDDEDPNRIYLYEVYRDDAAVKAHTQMPHYLRWQEAVKGWFAIPRSLSRCTNIFPTDDAWT